MPPMRNVILGVVLLAVPVCLSSCQTFDREGARQAIGRLEYVGAITAEEAQLMYDALDASWWERALTVLLAVGGSYLGLQAMPGRVATVAARRVGIDAAKKAAKAHERA